MARRLSGSSVLRSRAARATGAAVALAAVPALVAGCASTSDEPSVAPTGAYAARIAELEGEIVSDLERQILADGTITREEYEEAHTRLQQCVEDGGGAVQLHPDEHGFYTYQVDAASEPIFLSCETGTTGVVAGLYRDMTVNPANEDFMTLIRDCMVAAGALEQGTTVEQFDAEFFTESPAALDDPAIAEQFDTCFGDPLGLLVAGSS